MELTKRGKRGRFWEIANKEEREMPEPKPIKLELSAGEQQSLEKMIKRHTVSQQIGIRGRIILGAGAGKNNSRISEELGVNRETVRLWRERWIQLQPIPLGEMGVEERLEDLPRSGAPARITADQRCQIEALACEQPEKSGRPISHWTGREIAEEIMKRGIVEQISARHAGGLLKRRRHQTASNPLLADARPG
jgi:transposase